MLRIMDLKGKWGQPIQDYYGPKQLIDLAPPDDRQLAASRLEVNNPLWIESNGKTFDFFLIGLFKGKLEPEEEVQSYLFLNTPGNDFRWPFRGAITGYFVSIGKQYPIALHSNLQNMIGHPKETCLALPEEEVDKLVHLLKGIAVEKASPINFNLVINAYLGVLLQHVSQIFHERIAEVREESNVIVNFRRELSNYYSDYDVVTLPTVRFISDQLRVSPNYLSQTLKTQTGQSALTHIHNHIVDQAKKLLANPVPSIGQVAYQLGFDYPNYFARLFRKKTGMSPTQYRAMLFEDSKKS